MENLTDENKRSIINGFLRNMLGIADKEYQNRIWIKGEGPECDDFDETVCDFFGDSDSIIKNYKDFGITEHQHLLLKKFHTSFKRFCHENNYPEEFIDTPEWNNIINMAQEVLIAFNYQKDSRSFS